MFIVELLKIDSVKVALPRFSPHFVAHQQTVECDDVAARDVRMEVEYGTLTECKEGGDGARVQVEQSEDGKAEDSTMQIDDGQ